MISSVKPHFDLYFRDYLVLAVIDGVYFYHIRDRINAAS